MTDLQRDFIIQAIEGGCPLADLIMLLRYIQNYQAYEYRLKSAISPESESLARWGLQTAREDFYTIAKRYDVELYSISFLAEE